MRGRLMALLAGSAVLAALAAASPALGAMHKTVCSSGCAFTSINAAIEAASEGATITIGKGTYAENVVVTKPVTLNGSGKGTVIEPAVSNPVCGGGSLCGGSASNIVLVEADNVTIHNLKLEGDNPSLTSGVVVGGKDIDARNGIITNHAAGKYNGLTVSKVIVEDVYLRGIYASSGGTFNFNHDTVKNVQGEEASIAMFNFEGSGSMDDNTVSQANDALSANWSKGTEFAGNKVSDSGSGIHTDNNGGSGGMADKISGNQVSGCRENGYGIWVFVPYVSASVTANRISGCYIGLAAFGGAVSGEGPLFRENRVDGTGAKTNDPAGSYGAYVTTDQLGFAFGDVTARFSENTIQNNANALFVTQSNPSPEQPAGGQATVTARTNVFMHNPGGAKGEPGTVVDAKENWWGCKQGPSSTKCDPATGTVTYTPWLLSKP